MISVQMCELQYLSSDEKSLSKRTALKKRDITHNATTHVRIVVRFSSAVVMGALSLGFRDAAVLFFSLVSIQLFITDAPWNSGWTGYGLSEHALPRSSGFGGPALGVGPDGLSWGTAHLVSQSSRRDVARIAPVEGDRGLCPRGFDTVLDDPLGQCADSSEWAGYVCTRAGAVLAACP